MKKIVNNIGSSILFTIYLEVIQIILFMTTVVNIRKNVLNKRGIKDFNEWNNKSNTLYIGRNMSYYVPGTYQSKWANPFSVKKYSRTKCLEMYKNFVLNNHELYNSLEELKNKELGCWCKPELCHGDILIELLKNK